VSRVCSFGPVNLVFGPVYLVFGPVTLVFGPVSMLFGIFRVAIDHVKMPNGMSADPVVVPSLSPI